MFRIVLTLLAVVGTVLFLVQSIRGKEYEYMFDALDEDDFPMKDLYSVGFAWMQTGLFKPSASVNQKLKKSSVILYGSLYSDYYTNVVWAQIITFIHLISIFTLILASMFYGIAGFVLFVGIVVQIIMVYYFLKQYDQWIEERTKNCERELPEVVSTMAILINSGMTLREAWNTIGSKGEGDIYALMRTATENMNNGFSDRDAMYLFGQSSASTEVKKFTNALVQSIEKGGNELSGFLMQQSSEMWNSKRQRMLQEGEKAATKLLMPIMLIFVGILIIVITAAFAGLLS